MSGEDNQSVKAIIISEWEWFLLSSFYEYTVSQTSTMHMYYLCNKEKEKIQVRGCFLFVLFCFLRTGASRSSGLLVCSVGSVLGGAALEVVSRSWSEMIHESASAVCRVDHLRFDCISSLFFFPGHRDALELPCMGRSPQILTLFQKLFIQKHFSFQQLFLL